jgi:hypothetical protein
VRFHSKKHNFNHFSIPVDGYPDSASDPIASSKYPFQGEFIINGELSATTASFTDGISSLDVGTLTVTDTIDELTIDILHLPNGFALGTDGGNLSNVNAETLNGASSIDFVSVLSSNIADGYVGLDNDGLIGQDQIPPNINLTSINNISIDSYLIEADLSSTVAPLIPSGNDIGYEIPIDYIPTDSRDRYVGFYDYNASSSLSSVALSSGVWTKIENDGGGDFSLSSFRPTGMIEIWDVNNNTFDWDGAGLNLGDMIDIRLDIEATSDSPSQIFEVDLVMAIGTPSEYRLPFLPKTLVKTSGDVLRVIGYNGVYIGNNDTLSGGAYFEIKPTDGGGTMKVNGLYIKIVRRGF